MNNEQKEKGFTPKEGFLWRGDNGVKGKDGHSDGELGADLFLYKLRGDERVLCNSS